MERRSQAERVRVQRRAVVKVHGVCRMACGNGVDGAQMGSEIMNTPLISENIKTKETGATQ